MTPAEVGVIGLLNFFELSTIPISLAIVLYKENNKIFIKKKLWKIIYILISYLWLKFIVYKL